MIYRIRAWNWKATRWRYTRTITHRGLVLPQILLQDAMKSHAIYLAIISILIIVLVCAVAKAARAAKLAKDIADKFGIREVLRSSIPRTASLRNASARELLKPRTYEEYRREVDSLLGRALALGEFGRRTKLTEACELALKGGKRLRPIILMEVTRVVNLHRQRESLRDGEGDAPTPSIRPTPPCLSSTCTRHRS